MTRIPLPQPSGPPRRGGARRGMGVLLGLLLCGCTGLFAQAQGPLRKPATIAAFLDEARKEPSATFAVQGTVTRTWGRQGFFLQDATGALFLFKAPEQQPVHAGDRLEVVGPVSLQGITPHLQVKELHDLPPGDLPEPVTITTEEAVKGAFDARLVRLRGRLIGSQAPEPHSITILLQSGDLTFPVEAAPEDAGYAPWPRLVLGELVEMTGILSVRGSNDTNPWPIRLLACSRRDAAVISAAPWWMPPRLYRFLAASAAALVLVLAWVFVLRRQVTRQTAELRTQYEKDVAIERRLQEMQKLESLGVLAGGIAHDFNNLLTAILGHASLSREEVSRSSPIDRSLEQIELAAERAAELCRQMLAYSGRGKFLLTPVDLNAVAHETAELARASVSRKATLDFAFTHPLPAVHGDGSQLRQVLMSLVINASEALGDAAGTVTISTGAVHATHGELAGMMLGADLTEGDYVWVEVRDTGAGMNTATLARIFEPFFSTKFTGRGLGLAAVLGIMRSHHGALRVTSEPGKGSAFRLLLPVSQEAPPKAAPAPQAASEPADRTGCVVLVADDEDGVRLATRRMLETFGCEVVLTRDGVEAVEKFRESPERFTFVLLDLTMPRMDGLQTHQELRRIRPEVPVLLMSGHTEEDALSRFAGEQLTGFLQKPFRPAALREKIDAVMR